LLCPAEAGKNKISTSGDRRLLRFSYGFGLWHENARKAMFRVNYLWFRSPFLSVAGIASFGEASRLFLMPYPAEISAKKVSVKKFKLLQLEIRKQRKSQVAERKRIMDTKKLYVRSLKTTLELDEDMVKKLENFWAGIRVKEQQEGRCFVTRKKIYLCDGVCEDCEFHREGQRVIDTKICKECEVPTDKRGRSAKCRKCKAYKFLPESLTLDAPTSEEKDTPQVDKIISYGMNPADIAVDNTMAEHYCKEAEKLTPDGGKFVARIMVGQTISEAARKMGVDQRTLNSRKTKLEKTMRFHQ